MIFRRFRVTATGVAMLATMGTGASSMQTPDQFPSFSAIEVPNGGHVVVRSGPVPRVTVVKGSREYLRMSVNRAGVLVIEKCRAGCSRRYELEVEVVAPALSRISLANGGRIQSIGSFPRQGDLTASVSNGGTVDVRSMGADNVTASVEQGGRILTVPRGALVTRVSNGGVITYWGEAKVRSSTEHGGVVHKGEAGDISRPLSDVGGVHLPHPVSPFS